MGLIHCPLSSLSSRLARFLFSHKSQMVDDVRIPSLKDDGMSDSSVFEVDDWFKMVRAGNNSEDDVKTLMVQQLDWYKNDVGFQHEYLVATISGPGNIRIFLRFERRSTSEQLKKAELSNIVGDENERGMSERDKRVVEKALDEERKLINAPKGPYASRFSKVPEFSAGSSPGSNLKAADHVVRVRNPQTLNDNSADGAYLMFTYHNFQNPFSMRDLAIIVHEVSKDSPRYNVITEQCYWFARTIVRVATKLCDPRASNRTARSDRAGKFINRTVCRDDPSTIEKFVKKVTDSIEADNSRITMIWNDGKGGRLDAERQKLQAEQDKARAEARAHEEAEARAQAEARADAESKARETEAKGRSEAEARMREMEEELVRYRGRGTSREA
ncbi:hypothetical protein CPC08DRAFT_824798 [Agrocybe pediades]|nr:hypothetical protein CPC08DRAFT_824798 [Agrocybe pediades]